MRIATWNINGLRARIDFIRTWLEAREPDVVGLQELKITDEEFPFEMFHELGYDVVTHGQKGWNGVAILTRSQAETEQVGLPGQEDFGARLVSVKIADLHFATVYCPNGKDVGHDDFPRKLEWFDALAGYWAGRYAADTLAVLCGDFNIVRHALDSWRGAGADGGLFHTVEERARLDALLQTGLFDIFRERHPDLEAHSWWDYRGGAFHRGQGLRIDLVLGSAALLARVRNVEIDRDFRKKKDGLTASDHAPVIVDLE